MHRWGEAVCGSLDAVPGRGGRPGWDGDVERPKRLRGADGTTAGGSGGVRRRVFDGDYDEADDPKRAWQRTMAHNTIVDALCRFLKDCGMDGVQAEFKYWDPARVGKDGSRRVPDVVCTHPRTGVEYVLDARIYWNTMSEGPTGYTAYSHTGWGAEHGESDKRESWSEAIKKRSADGPLHGRSSGV